MTKTNLDSTPIIEEKTEEKLESSVEESNVPDKTKETLKLPADNKPESIYDLENMTTEQTEQQARKWGYIPSEDFKGDQTRHMSAEEYLRVSEQKLPALKHQIKKQDVIIENLRKMNENLNVDLESQKQNIETQKKEASDEQDFFKYSNLEKQEAKIEKRQEELKADMTALETDYKTDEVNYRDQQVHSEVQDWIKGNQWYTNPNKSPAEHAKKSYADERFTELSKQYPNADPNAIMTQISTDLNKFSQSLQTNTNYSYAPGGQNAALGQVSQDKTEGNLNEGATKMLRNIQAISRSPEEKARLTKNFLSSSTNDSLFKWYKK